MNYDDEYFNGCLEADEPDYYYCTLCNNTQVNYSPGCDSCGMYNTLEEGNF